MRGRGKHKKERERVASVNEEGEERQGGKTCREMRGGEDKGGTRQSGREGRKEGGRGNQRRRGGS